MGRLLSFQKIMGKIILISISINNAFSNDYRGWSIGKNAGYCAFYAVDM
jgi:hypothetical protein